MLSLQSEKYYHIYNRANGWEKIFYSAENYRFFLEKYCLYISPYVNTYCYCLMPNHFHFLVSIKNEREILSVLARGEKTFPKFQTLERLAREQNPARNEFVEKLISKQFSNFFSCYTQAFNKQQKRRGSLFMKNFKRKEISDSQYLKNLVQYIHLNPVEAGLCYDPSGWKHSSYPAILNNDSDFLQTGEVRSWYFSEDNFRYMHHHSDSVIPPKEIMI